MTPEPPQPGTDWRVTDGFAIGREPEFLLTDFQARAVFPTTGAMLTYLWAKVTSLTPTLLESRSVKLTDCEGYARISAELPDRTFLHMGGPHFQTIESAGNRGFLAVVPDGFTVHLQLPPDQFASLLPLLTFAPAARLRIEVDRTLDQGLEACDQDFWNDRLSPTILFNEFEIVSEPEAIAG